MKFAICNLGCKVNNYEANWYSEQLAKKYEEVDFRQKADIYIINSCSVTNMAGSKSRQMIHKARKQNSDACIVACSCYVQMEYEKENIFDDVDILVGSKDKTKIPQLIEQYLKDGQKINIVEKFEKTDFEEMMLNDFNQTRAYLKIQDGCNQFCSYCTIPFARGRERSLNHETVIKQAKKLVEAGHIEIVLTGIHTGRYNDGMVNLTQLIKLLLDEVEGLKRIRLSSIEISEVSDELIALMKNDLRIARHLHIPVQTGNDRLLKLNNRPYTCSQFLDRIEEIRALLPGISISTDVIAGLPSETEQEADEIAQFIADCNFSFLHVFPYARKEHTFDATLKQQVSEIDKKRRAERLTKLSERLYNEYNKTLVGQKVEVVFETYKDGYLKGHCSQYVLVKVSSETDYSHQLKTVLITGVHEDYLFGEIL